MTTTLSQSRNCQKSVLSRQLHPPKVQSEKSVLARPTQHPKVEAVKIQFSKTTTPSQV